MHAATEREETILKQMKLHAAVWQFIIVFIPDDAHVGRGWSEKKKKERARIHKFNNFSSKRISFASSTLHLIISYHHRLHNSARLSLSHK